MKKDNLIETILERAYTYLDKQEISKAIATFQRAFQRVKARMEEENIKSFREYDDIYNSMYEVSYWVLEYLETLQDGFWETGDKKYLEQIKQFCIANYSFYQNDEELVINIEKKKAEVLFEEGNVAEALEKMEQLLQKYEKRADIYLLYASLYKKDDKTDKAMKILQTGIIKCKEYKEELLFALEEMQKNNKK